MYVRVFDKKSNNYFKSEVYAIINSGWYGKQLVVVPSDDDYYLKFFDYLDKSDPKTPKVLINVVKSNDCYCDIEWMCQRSNSVDENLDEFAELLSEDIRFFEYRGYAWIYNNKPLLVRLLNGDKVSIKGYENKIIDFNAYKIKDWNYIEDQKDVDFILEQTFSFHDTVLKELNYTSGSFVDDRNFMHCTDSIRQITVRLDSQMCRPIEMVFEGVTALNLRPCSDNHSSNLTDASLFVHNASIWFFDKLLDNIDKSYKGTWVESYGLRWRFCDK